MNELLVICGPTATGKTTLGVKLAEKFDGEIVSADSRQVYQGMDIATGKDLGRFGKIPVWLLDVVKPNQEFSVAPYVELAWRVIEDIWRRGKLPILVGGTGFYIKGLIDGIKTLGVVPNWELRKKLSNLEIEKLRKILEETCPERLRGMNVSDRKNPRRLIRAIEIANARLPAPDGVSLSGQAKTQKIAKTQKNLDVLFVGLKAPYKELYQRIDKRIDEQVKMGARKELRHLLAQGYSWDLPAMTAMGYDIWRPYFDNKATKEEVIKKWKFGEHAYARRQKTWFKKALRQAQGKTYWFDITKNNWQNKVENLVGKWYDKLDA